MNKKLYAIILLAVVSMFAGYNVYQNLKSDVTLSDLALANVEALADDEINPLCPNGCITKKPKGCYCNGWYPNLQEYGEK